MEKIISAALVLLASLAAMSQSTCLIGRITAGRLAPTSSVEGANLAAIFAVDNDYSTRWANERINPAIVNTGWLFVDLRGTYTIRLSFARQNGQKTAACASYQQNRPLGAERPQVTPTPAPPSYS